MKTFTVRFNIRSTGKPGKRTVRARDAEEAKARVAALVPGSFWHAAKEETK